MWTVSSYHKQSGDIINRRSFDYEADMQAFLKSFVHPGPDSPIGIRVQDHRMPKVTDTVDASPYAGKGPDAVVVERIKPKLKPGVKPWGDGPDIA